MSNHGLEGFGLTVTPDFITPEEEAAILAAIPPSVPQKTKSRNSIRRYGSDLPYRSNMVSADIPAFLSAIGEKLATAGLLAAPPDSITINEYRPGQEIAAHIDSPSSGEVISVLSLLSDAIMVFTRPGNRDRHEVALPPRSVAQMRGDIRWVWRHAVLPVAALRYSLVFRCGTGPAPKGGGA